LGSVKGQHGTV